MGLDSFLSLFRRDRAAPYAVDDFDGVTVRPSARARRMTVKVDHRSGQVTLVLPPRTSAAAARRFLDQAQDWIAARKAALPPQTPFADGAEFPFQGRRLRIRHRPEARGTVWIENDEVNVAGAAEHLPRRLRDWLGAEARRKLAPAATEAADRIGAQVARVVIRDTRTRWGSCSARGHLSFSWRLVLAPPFVADYLVAHEVAHLRHMNHGAAFWALVDRLTPHRRAAEAWLKANGASLQRVG